MHTQDLSPWTHQHLFDEGNPLAERGTRLVVWITAVMMVVEIVAGWWFNSMALLADGWHMSSHALAIGLSAFAYAAARRYARDARFAFGTWKIEVLAGFASAVFLVGVAGFMVIGSIERLLRPAPIQYGDAIVIASIGLGVNILCALILGHAHHHSSNGGSAHEHRHLDHPKRHDLNLKSAYVHVIADAATSVFAITALGGGMLFGWAWLDPVMGLVGAAVVGSWALGLLRGTSRILLDREMDDPVVSEIRAAVESPYFEGETRIADLHVWRVGKSSYACALTVVTHDRKLTPTQIRQRLAVHPEVAHATIEVHACG
ncbi:MAG TPA: CDF family Co(II)/Ni(II) efflux transporter DmeF [Casimicrobiaceae bacterium]|nr:CDF family Co(II)/Ni(II) efflux transporter DmeF [Casimicrobiaceae bacterium]